jgi:hypothetical protein
VGCQSLDPMIGDLVIVQRNVDAPSIRLPVEAAGFPAAIPCPAAQRNTLNAAGLDMDGLSKSKKRKFSFETV